MCFSPTTYASLTVLSERNMVAYRYTKCKGAHFFPLKIMIISAQSDGWSEKVVSPENPNVITSHPNNVVFSNSVSKYRCRVELDEITVIHDVIKGAFSVNV